MVSSRDRFAESTGRLVDHFGDAVSTVTVHDIQGADDLGTGGVTPTPRSFTVDCTPFVTYGSKMIDGQRVLVGDGVVSYRKGATPRNGELFDPLPGMTAETEDGRVFSIEGVYHDAGGIDLHLREGRPA